MSEKPEGVHVGAILIGIFLILFGACLVLVGGACAAMWLQTLRSEPPRSFNDPGALMLLVSFVALAFGIVCCVGGVALMRGRKRPHARETADAGEASESEMP